MQDGPKRLSIVHSGRVKNDRPVVGTTLQQDFIQGI
jgi:hypothetical protein